MLMTGLLHGDLANAGTCGTGWRNTSGRTRPPCKGRLKNLLKAHCFSAPDFDYTVFESVFQQGPCKGDHLSKGPPHALAFAWSMDVR